MRLLFFCIPLFFSCQTARWLTVQQTAKPANLPAGAPKYADVCFSSRWERPRNAADSLETFAAAHSFHATYINWVYTTNPAFVKKADSLGYRLQVALSPTMTDLPFGSEKREKGRLVNAKGEPVTAPWMKSFGGYWWGCVNHPDFRATYFEHLKAALEAGAHGFQVDDPGMGYLLVRNGWEDVCHCEFCRQKADSLGVKVADIQEVSVLEFHREMKRRAEKLAGRPVPFSCNNFAGDWSLFPFSHFDFGVAEAPERHANPEYLFAAVREARLRGKAQVFSFVSERDWLIQKMIAAGYAAGANMLVPWDVWQGGGKDRYFGKSAVFAPYFAFVRANARWLDGYEDAFFTSSQADLRFDQAADLPVSFDEYRRQIHAFVRAKPGDEAAPVVLHLVDFHPVADTFSIRLNERRFFKNGIASVEMLTPVAYEKAAHEAAEATGDFSKLAKSERLAFSKTKNLLRLQLPKLERHWALLIIYPKRSYQKPR